MLSENRFDLVKFNPISPDLNLIICPADKFDVAVLQITPKIAGLVETTLRISAERIAHKLLICQFRLVQVTSGQPVPSNVELSRYSNGHRLVRSVQDINPRISNRPADGNCIDRFTQFFGDPITTCERCTLCGTVSVNNLSTRQ